MRKYLLISIAIIIIFGLSCNLLNPAKYDITWITSNHIFSDGLLCFSMGYVHRGPPYDKVGNKVYFFDVDKGLVKDTAIFEVMDNVYLCKTDSNIYVSNDAYDDYLNYNCKISLNTNKVDYLDDTIIYDVGRLDVSPDEKECVYYKEGMFHYLNFDTRESKHYECDFYESLYKSQMDWNNRELVYVDSGRNNLISL